MNEEGIKIKKTFSIDIDDNILNSNINNILTQNDVLNKLNQLYLKIEEERYIRLLLNRLDKALRYNDYLKEHCKYRLNTGHLRKMEKILRGDDSNE